MTDAIVLKSFNVGVYTVSIIQDQPSRIVNLHDVPIGFILFEPVTDTAERPTRLVFCRRIQAGKMKTASGRKSLELTHLDRQHFVGELSQYLKAVGLCLPIAQGEEALSKLVSRLLKEYHPPLDMNSLHYQFRLNYSARHEEYSLQCAANIAPGFVLHVSAHPRKDFKYTGFPHLVLNGTLTVLNKRRHVFALYRAFEQAPVYPLKDTIEPIAIEAALNRWLARTCCFIPADPITDVVITA